MRATDEIRRRAMKYATLCIQYEQGEASQVDGLVASDKFYESCDRLDAKFASLVEAGEAALLTLEVSYPERETPAVLEQLRAALRAAKGDT